MNSMLRIISSFCLISGWLLVNPYLSVGQQEDAFYAGDTHVHTAVHAITSIDERIEEGLEGGLDWVATTRHKRSGAYWKGKEVVLASNRPGK
jgi:hypothetical protein